MTEPFIFEDSWSAAKLTALRHNFRDACVITESPWYDLKTRHPNPKAEISITV